MAQTSLTNRAWWSVVGAATAASGLVAGLVPLAQTASAAPSNGARDNALRADAADRADGTYESCAAYFGFGKWRYGVLDVVSFDVGDQNGADGATHAVGTDTQVVLELTNDEGDVRECTPVEVTEAQWDDAMDDLDIDLPPGTSFPAWPGPGFYAYPTVSMEPYIDDFGPVEAVGFKVTGVPGGHTLVSPSGVKPLVQHFPIGFDESSDTVDPRVVAFVAAQAGPDAAAAFQAALETCDAGDPLVVGGDLLTAVNALRTYRGLGPVTAGDVGCWDVGNLNTDVSYLRGLAATVTYEEPIVLSLPTVPTTAPPTTAPPTTAPPAIAARPVVATPRYTG